MKTLVIAGGLLAFAGSALAGDDPFPRRFKPDQFPQVVELLETGMQPGGDFPAKPQVQEKVRTLLTQIGHLLETNTRLADLDSVEKAAIEERRILINGLLTGKHVAGKDSRDSKRRSPDDMLDRRTTQRTTSVDSVY